MLRQRRPRVRGRAAHDRRICGVLSEKWPVFGRSPSAGRYMAHQRPQRAARRSREAKHRRRQGGAAAMAPPKASPGVEILNVHPAGDLAQAWW